MHDGYVDIYKNDMSLMNDSDYSLISNHFNGSLLVSKLISENVVVRNSSISEACYLKAVEFDKNIYNFDSIVYAGSINKNDLLIGCKLFEKLNIDIGDEISVIYNVNGEIIIDDFNVSGIFKTNIPDFDKYYIYCDIGALNKLNNNEFDSIVGNISSSDNHLPLNESLNDYTYYKWDLKYLNFLKWLNSYDGPINILLCFIMLICFINIFSSIYIDNNYRIKDLFLFNYLGFKKKEIILLFSFKITFLTFFSGLVGLFLVFLFQFIQNYFNVIRIPEYIYYMPYMPIQVDVIFSFILISSLTLATFFLSLIFLKITVFKKIAINK